MPSFAFDCPDSAIDALAERLAVVGASDEVSDLSHRVLAEDVRADRDSPAADVSAMDGYALDLRDFKIGVPISISGESAAGSPPPNHQSGTATRIFTGAIVPDGCNLVIKCEDTVESDQQIVIQPSVGDVQSGEHIRRAGENATAGSTVLSAGAMITAASRATLANFGVSSAKVFDRVRVSVMTTGDEVGSYQDVPPKPWQLRDSNRSSVSAVLTPNAWIDCHDVSHSQDNRSALAEAISSRLNASDALVLTGGVSMGDYDFVPDVVRELGGEIVFHGLPVRPGKPILGAATKTGQLILGLPGNPVSATVGANRFLLPLLAKQSGQANWNRPRTLASVTNPDEKTIPLHWMKLVRLVDDGRAEIVASRGSGDLVSLGKADGYVSVPPGEGGEGPWPYFAF